MLTFAQFVEDLSKQDIALPPAEVRRMRERFGAKTLQMGHLQEDGSMLVPIDCIVEAARSLGTQTLTEAATALKSEQMISMLHSVEELVERVGQARKRKLEQMVEKFQSEPEDAKAHQQWKEVEKTIFGVEYRD
jgi:hypothetical protein